MRRAREAESAQLGITQANGQLENEPTCNRTKLWIQLPRITNSPAEGEQQYQEAAG